MLSILFTCLDVTSVCASGMVVAERERLETLEGKTMNQNSNVNGGRASSPDGAKKNVVDEAKQAATQAASDVKQVATKATEKVREQATQRIDAQKDRAVEKIGGVADAIRTAGDSMDEGPLPDLAGRAADSIEGLADYFKSRTVGDLIGEVERFARREPAIFLGASFAIGLIGGRFLKSSSRSSGRSEQRSFRGSYDDEYDYHPYGLHEHELDRGVEGRRYDTAPEPSFIQEQRTMQGGRLDTATPTPMARPVTTSPVTTSPIRSVGTETTGNKTPSGNRGGF